MSLITASHCAAAAAASFGVDLLPLLLAEQVARRGGLGVLDTGALRLSALIANCLPPSFEAAGQERAEYHGHDQKCCVEAGSIELCSIDRGFREPC